MRGSQRHQTARWLLELLSEMALGRGLQQPGWISGTRGPVHPIVGVTAMSQQQPARILGQITPHYRVPPKWALMSFRLKNSNPRTPIVTEMRTNHAVTNVATPKLWTVTILLLGVVKARTTKRTTDETAQIQRRLWKTSIEKRDQGCNCNSPTPVASPHNDMQPSRTARSFS
jgi:hypothetical protein